MDKSLVSKSVKAHSFIALIKKYPCNNEKILQTVTAAQGDGNFLFASEDTRMEVSFTLRTGELTTGTNGISQRHGRLIIGDDAEWQDSSGQKNMANAVFIEYDLIAQCVKVMSSIVGLPPVFIYKTPGIVMIASDLYMLSMVPGVRLYLDPEGVRELCSVGHPIGHRTLFKDVNMVRGGHSVTLNSEGGIAMSRSWSLTESAPLKDWNEYTALQIEAFKDAMSSIDLSRSFLSLTAGLDTRTILAALIQMKRILPAWTMSGEILSLDARAARDLCKAYGMEHTVLVLGDDFHKNLPDYVQEASRLSGGLASLAQAHEVYFYKKVQNRAAARLSGNLGNQVGRRGAEKISLRNGDLSILSEEFIEQRVPMSDDQWLKSAKSNDGSLDYNFLLHNEVPFSSVANYSLGNHFVIQQSPYANRRLIEAAQLKPTAESSGKTSSLIQVRLKDLRHRFFGETEAYSFQVKLIKHIDGYAASYPINWGWRAKGGVSVSGLMFGGCAFVDALASSKGLDHGMLYNGFKKVHIAGLHEYTPFRTWMRSLRDFLHNTFSSQTIKQSGLFNERRLNIMLEEHYSSKRCHYKALVFALDLALAKQTFKATIK